MYAAMTAPIITKPPMTPPMMAPVRVRLDAAALDTGAGVAGDVGEVVALVVIPEGAVVIEEEEVGVEVPERQAVSVPVAIKN